MMVTWLGACERRSGVLRFEGTGDRWLGEFRACSSLATVGIIVKSSELVGFRLRQAINSALRIQEAAKRPARVPDLNAAERDRKPMPALHLALFRGFRQYCAFWCLQQGGLRDAEGVEILRLGGIFFLVPDLLRRD